MQQSRRVGMWKHTQHLSLFLRKEIDFPINVRIDRAAKVKIQASR